jgi:hypothetical protein
MKVLSKDERYAPSVGTRRTTDLRTHKAARKISAKKSKQEAGCVLRVHRPSDATRAGAKVMPVPRHKKSDVHYTLGASTKHFDIFWPSSFKTKGKGHAIAESIARHCETDFNIISGYFADTKIDHFNVYILGNRKAGSFHYGCGGTDLYVDPGAPQLGLVAEMVEVFEDAYGYGWDCGASNGEGLSRVLAEALHPAELDTGVGKRRVDYSTGSFWLNAPRLDYVDQTYESDQDFVSIGCATLFLNWLRFQHGYKWEQIILSGDSGTLGATFKNLTKRSDGYTQFLTFMNKHFPILQEVPSGIASDTPFPFSASSQWRDWENLGGTLTSSPTVASRARGSMDCFMRSKDGDLDWKALDGSDVFDANLGHPHSGKFKGAPAAISWGYGLRLDMFVRGSDDALWHFTLPGLLLNDWQKIDIEIADAPAVASWAPNRLDVFTRSSNGEIIHTFSDGGSHFTVGRNLGHPKHLPFEGAPAAISRRPGTIDVFARGGDHTIWRIVFGGDDWGNWIKVAEDIADGPAVASWAPHRVDLFGRNSHGELVHNHSDDEIHFTKRNNLGQPPTGPFKGAPAAVSMKPNQLDVFVRGADDALWHRSWS